MHVFGLQLDNEITLVQPELYLAKDLFHLLDDNRQHIAEFLDFTDAVNDVKDEEIFIKRMIEEQAAGEGRLFLIYYKSQLAGTIDYHAVSKAHRKAEIGYWLTKELNGHGIMTRCVKGLCDFGFNTMELNKLTIIAQVENVGSNKVAQKAGFKLVALEEQEIYRNDEFVDINKYALLKRDYIK